MGEALYHHRRELPTYRAHNEQAMAHTAIAFAKAQMRRRMMAVTTPSARCDHLVTAAALAHVNRLPVLLLRATCSLRARRTRCCNKWKTSRRRRVGQTIACGLCRVTSIASCDPEQLLRLCRVRCMC